MHQYYRINHQITSPTVRLIDETAKQIGVMSIAEARQKSIESEMDLVEIAPKAVPPVVKLIAYSKFKYQEAKKLKAEKKGNKGGDLKKIQMTPFIGQGDYETRVKKATSFFATGNKVKLSIKFQGRQIAHQEFGYNVANRFKADLAEIATPEGEPKLIGKKLFVIYSPIKKKS